MFLNPPNLNVAAIEVVENDNNDDSGAKDNSEEDKEDLKSPMSRESTKEMEARSEIDAKKLKIAGAMLSAKKNKRRTI